MSTIQQQPAESDQEQEEAGQVAESNKEQKAGGSEQLPESDTKKPEEEGGSDRFCSNYLETLFPLKKFNGSIYPYSTGSMKALFVTDPDMVKELGKYRPAKGEPWYLGKPRYLQGALLGMGIFASNGDLWKHERDKVIVPELLPKKAEGMVHLMVGSANEMLASWENIIDKQGGSAEVVVDETLRNFAADVISKACFGSSYSELSEIFTNIRQLQMALAEQTMIFGVPGSRYLPTNNNIEMWRPEASIRSLILNMAKKRREHI
ncbi:hypothetical protein U9M48_030387 [Paspalum notatum var. saurae]|uniref:Cytochrome P450 n=1 Tax=Paspalum notatum var. saurae TaxID=547442 RepID=A0AAQ3X2J2_PASNO